MAEEDGFIRRWSRRKTQERIRNVPVAPRGADMPTPTDQRSDDQRTSESGSNQQPEPIEPEDLPDIESLDKSSDFTVFMREGVPDELKQMALRRLWRLDPVFNEVDGMVEYGEDFTKVSAEAVKTIYKVGKGMITEEEEEALNDQSASADTANSVGDDKSDAADSDASPALTKDKAQDKSQSVDPPETESDSAPEKAAKNS